MKGILKIAYKLLVNDKGKFAALLVGISLGGLLVGERAVPYMAGISVVALVASALSNLSGFDGRGPGVLWIYLPLLFVHSGLNFVLARGLRDLARRVEADFDQRRVHTGETVRTITQKLLTARLDLDALAKEAVTLIYDAFADVHDVQIFLVDKDRRSAVLTASTRQEETPVARIDVGSLGVIGRVTISGKSMIVRDTDEGPAYRRSAFLPGTRAEYTVALRIGAETVGALDLQSQKVDAFTAQDTESIRRLAEELAFAVDNARLYSEAQTRSVENQHLYEQAQSSLREIERLNRQLIGGAWAEYLRGSSPAPAYTLDLETGQSVDSAENTPTLSDASRTNQIVIRQNGTLKMVALPISVRGQVIGAMEFEIMADQDITPEQMSILQQVVERLGLAAENARLLEDAQRIAQREALVNEISVRLQAATGIDAVVAAATQSLADAFQSPRVAIRLGALTEEKL